MPSSPTIAAIATPQGRGGVGIIRLSGSQAVAIAAQLTKRLTFTPRYAHFCRFYSADDTLIDEGIVLYFAAPHSFTGEDVVEIHGHGGVVLQQMLLSRVFALGAVQAAAGEFSARAFDNDKLDLVQAEAIADMIDATSTQAAKSAMRSLKGEFSERVNELLEGLIQLRLYIEATIDFPEEEDVDFILDGQVIAKLDTLSQQLTQLLDTAEQGQLLRDGAQVVIAGRPNAGKSSLLNCLTKADRAIVTEIAGTTRDILHETINLNGLTVTLTDTAGLRETTDTVEQMGIDRAHASIESADLLMLVYDITIDQDPIALAQDLFGQLPSNQRLLLVANKQDKAPDLSIPAQVTASSKRSVAELQNSYPQPSYPRLSYPQVAISCVTGTGLSELIESLCQMLGYHPTDNTLIARTRHIDAIQRTADHVNMAVVQINEHQALELAADSLRQAQHSLGEITGKFGADELLGKIFSSFCIGK